MSKSLILTADVVSFMCNIFLCTTTGKGINYVLQELFQESLGMRQDVAHVLVLITDGRAQDNVVPPSRIARALGQSL